MNRVPELGQIDARSRRNADSGFEKACRFTLRISFLSLLFACAEPAWSASLTQPPVILPYTESNNAAAFRLVWPTTPGLRYEPQQSSDLRTWSTLSGYPSQAPGLAEQYFFNPQTNHLFFRVLQLDEQAPTIATRDPEAGAFGIRRFSRLSIGLNDQSAIVLLRSVSRSVRWAHSPLRARV